MRIHVVVTGRMYHLAENVPDEMQLDEGARVSDALSALKEQLSEPLPESCLVAVGGDHLGALSGYQDRPLRDGDELVLVAPVAGG